MKKLSIISLSFLLLVHAVTPVWSQDEAVAEAIAETVEVPGTPVENLKPNLRPLTVAVELTGNSGRIAGTLVESTQLSMKTAFGEAAIPMSEIAGVRLASGDDVSTTVIMLNGDSITGAIDIKQLTVETEWGTANIKGSSIQSLLFVPNVQWESSNNLSGKRWTLVDVKPASNPTQLNNGNSVLPAPNSPQRTNPGTQFRNGVILGQ